MKNKWLKAFTLLGLAQMITVNFLANTLPINETTTGYLSNQLKNLFTPQGATFAIWGVIYSFLLVFTLRILIWKMEKNARIEQTLHCKFTF